MMDPTIRMAAERVTAWHLSRFQAHSLLSQEHEHGPTALQPPAPDDAQALAAAVVNQAHPVAGNPAARMA